MANFKKETNYRYKVKNQNGLNNALYDYFEVGVEGSGCNYSKQEIRKSLQNYPTRYPCKITIVDSMFECARMYVDIENLTGIRRFWSKWFF